MNSPLRISGIYCIENTVTGKFYVGSSQNVEARIKQHLRDLRRNAHHSPKLQHSWNLYGEEAFHAGLLVACDKDMLNAFEDEYMVSLGAVDDGYNIAGRAYAPMRGRKMPEEGKAKIKASAKNRPPISEETRQRLREASAKREAVKKAAGFVVSEETRAKLSAAGKGRVCSEETKAKIGSKNRGRKYTEVMRENMSKAHAGKTLPEEQKAKISAGLLAAWAERKQMQTSNNSQVSQP